MEKSNSKPECVLVPPSAASPIAKRKLSEESKVATDADKTLCVTFQTNGFSRIVSYTEDLFPKNGDALQFHPSPSLDLKTLRKANGISICSRRDQPQSSSGGRIVSLKSKRPSKNGLNPTVWNGNAELHPPKRALLRCGPLPSASIRQLNELEETYHPKSNRTGVIAPNQRLGSSHNLIDGPSDPLDEVSTDNLTPKDDVLDCEALPESSHRYASAAVADELLLEASANFRSSRKWKFRSINTNPAKVFDSPSPDRTSKKRAHDPTEHPTANNVGDLVGTTDDPGVTTSKLNCRLPFNGHTEDAPHYRLCDIVLAGVVLREEHTSWLSDIPNQSEIMEVVNLIIGSSCKQIMLSGKCSEKHCISKHVIELNFNVPREKFNVFTKWFIENAVQPDLKAVLLVLSCLSRGHDDALMIVLSYAKIMMKLSTMIYKRALGIKLVEIMVNVLELRPWEATRALLVFYVTPETQLSDILGFLSSFEVAKAASKNQPLNNHLYESVSCLWHISKLFVCPSGLLFKLLKECTVKMPTDLKLTKDRILGDLLKLPRKLLRKEFHFIDKFLSKYYPQNSEVAYVFRTSILYGIEITEPSRDRGTYETSRVKGTGPVNPQWHYWDIQEARRNAFDLVVKKSREDKREEIDLHTGPITDLSKENLEVDVWCHDLFKMVSSRICLCYDENLLPSCDFSVEETDDFECLVEALISNKLGKVVAIMLACGRSVKAGLFEKCLQTLQREFELCDKSLIGLVVFEILKRLPGSLSDGTSVKSCFVCMVNSLVLKFYKEADYKTALKLLKAMRVAGVNHLEHAPRETSHQTFTIVCSDINFQCRLYPEAIRSLMYKNCLHFMGECFDRSFPEHFYLLEKLVMSMFRRFLKERHASHALDIFRLIFAAQENLHFPLNIGKYYEGVIFLSFVSDLKKNACTIGDGASLYIAVDRVCGNSVPFHSITYRSLLVELHRANSPEDVIRRTLRICLKKKIYPDFSRGPISPLVLDSHLAQEEISIYLKHYFTYFSVQSDLRALTDRPLVVRFSLSPPPDKKLFPVSNDIMKTSRSVPDALERFKSALDGFSSELYQTLDASFSQDSVTIPVQGVETLLSVFKPRYLY